MYSLLTSFQAQRTYWSVLLFSHCWEELSADPQAKQCGWFKDQFGLFWQVWPTAMGEMMKNSSREQIDRLTQVFLSMKKLDLATLQLAYEGKSR